ncbi:MAG TPA: hypothetical protein VLD62_11485 [Acidimicrobiia bacterium]|nr:hypothetical protein [Acidimicrobiia bacterium]
MRWSISLRADGDRVMEREEIVDLADAVAGWEGIASGIGTMSYSAQIVIEAPTSDEAVEQAIGAFTEAAGRAGLPPWPVAWAESISDESEFEEFG